MMKLTQWGRHCWLAVFFLSILTTRAYSQVNYAEALQKSIYFYDIQRSGAYPGTYGYAPGQNRVRWQSDQHTYDGYDLQLPPGGMTNGLGQLITDANKAGALQGGFRDAGDHPKWASSIGYATSMLAWTAVEYREQLEATGQMPYLLENIKWATDYMMRSILFTDENDPATYRVVCIVSDYRAEHGVAAYSGTITHRIPQRPHYYADKDAPNTPQVAIYASALGAASVAFRQAGNTAYADLLYANAARLHAFMAQYRGISRIKKADGTIIVTERQPNQAYYDAYAPGFGVNKIPETLDFTNMPYLAMQYRGATDDASMTLPASSFMSQLPAVNHNLPTAQPDWGNYFYYSQRSLAEIVRTISDESAFAHVWMHEAEKAKNGTTPFAAFHLSKAVQFFDNVLIDIVPLTPATTSHGEASVTPREVLPMRGSGYLNYETFAAILLNRLVSGDSRYADAMKNTLDFIISRPKSPGGLTYVMGRPSDQYPQGGSAADPFEAWGVFEQLTPRMMVAMTFAKDLPDLAKRNQYISWAESQVAYIFGANPQRRNFFTGMNIPGAVNEDIGLHANGLGSWGGFDERIPGTVSYTTENRNRIIGALIGGPRWDDTKPTSITDPARYTEVATFYQPCFTGVLASMVSRYGGSPLPADFPKAFLPDVDNDGQGDDIPNPIPSNSDWACREFPVHARQEATHATPTAATTAEVRITVNNRSRWPARAATAMSARYYFTLEPGITVIELRLRNPYLNITGVPSAEADLYGDLDGATFDGAADGVTLLSGTAAMGKVVEVSTDASGKKLCYVEIFFRNPTTVAYNYLFDAPTVAGGRYAPRVVADPLAAAQNFLSGITPARPDLNVVWPGGPYQVRNPISWAKRHELRHALVRLTFSAASDLTNDWSFARLPQRTGYTIPSSQAGNARYIPVYENGVLLCGDLPTSPAQVPDVAAVVSPTQDYAKALQRSLFYFETQRAGQVENGVTLPNGTVLPNRVEWRGNSHTGSSANGGDLFPTANLVGGLYENGNDYTKSTVAMAHAASMMAWSYFDYPTTYNNHPELKNSLLGNLKWISDFFKDQCFVYGNEADESSYKVYLFVTDRLADGSRHDEWAAAEVIDQLPASRRPVRRFFYADADAPNISHVSSMAGALAAASHAFRQAGGMDAYADELLTAARRLYNFCYRYTHGPNKMLNYTGQNIATRTLGTGAVANGNVFGVVKDMNGNLVRIEPFDTDGNPANGIQPVTDAVATRFEFASGTQTTTGSRYDPAIPDYYEFTNPTSGSGTAAVYSPTDSRILGWVHDNLAWAAIWLHQAETAKGGNLNGPSGTSLLNEAVTYTRAYIGDVSGQVGGATGSGINLLGSPVDYKLYATLMLYRLNAPVTADLSWWPTQYRDRLRHFFMGGHPTSGPSGAVPASVTPANPAANFLLFHANANGGLFNFGNNRLRNNGSLRPIIEASLVSLAFANYLDLRGQTGLINPTEPGATWEQLRDRIREVGQRNINGVLGDNPRRFSFMYGYHSDEIPSLSGVAGMKYVHHRTAAGYFAGAAHRTMSTGNRLANPAAAHVLYGGIAGGPDNNFLNNFQTEGASQTDVNTLSRPANGWTFQHNTPVLYYTSPMVYALAALNPTGSGSLTADFPAPVVKPLELSTSARLNTATAGQLTLRATVNNQTRWPARAYNQASFRYYFTLDSGVAITGATVNGHDASPAPTITGPVQVEGDLHYFEVSFAGNALAPIGLDATRPNTYTPTGTLPNTAQFFRRTVDLTISYSGNWKSANDWSAAGLGNIEMVSQQLPMYQAGLKINGNEPGNFDMEAWVDLDNSGTVSEGDFRLNGTGQPIDFGTILLGDSAQRQVLLRNVSPNPITIFPVWSVPTGFKRVGDGELTVASGSVEALTVRMMGQLPGPLGGTFYLINNGANTLENPLKFSVLGLVNEPCAFTSVVLGGQSACVRLTNTYTQQVTIQFAHAPASGTLVVNGQHFAIGSSPQTVTLTNLVADGQPVDLSVAFSDDSTCSFFAPAFFTAPADCQPEIAPLTLSALCSVNPDAELSWRIVNPNPDIVEVSWQIVGTSLSGTLLAAPGSTDFNTETQLGMANQLRIQWLDGPGLPVTATATSSGNTCGPITISGLTLTSMCSSNPAVQRRWRVRNPNPFAVRVYWSVYKVFQEGSYVAPPGDSFFFTATEMGANTTFLRWRDHLGMWRQQVKASSREACANGREMAMEEASDDVLLNEVSVFPNPSKGQAFVMVNAAPEEPVAVEIFTTTGQQVSQFNDKGSFQRAISLPNRGLYLVKVQFSGQTWTKQLLVE